MKFLTRLLLLWILPISGQSMEILLRIGNPALRSLVNQRLPGYAGVLPYIRDNQGVKYILLSREAAGNSKGHYCGFGGTNELNARKKRYHRLLYTAMKEVREESVKLLNLNESYILNNSHFHFDCRNKDSQKLTALTSVSRGKYRSAQALYEAREKVHDDYQEHVYYGGMPYNLWPYLEKDDFQWISVESLLPAIRNHQAHDIKVKVLNGDVINPFDVDTSALRQDRVITLRPAFLETLIGLQGALTERE